MDKSRSQWKGKHTKEKTKVKRWLLGKIKAVGGSVYRGPGAARGCFVWWAVRKQAGSSAGAGRSKRRSSFWSTRRWDAFEKTGSKAADTARGEENALWPERRNKGGWRWDTVQFPKEEKTGQPMRREAQQRLKDDLFGGWTTGRCGISK